MEYLLRLPEKMIIPIKNTLPIDFLKSDFINLFTFLTSYATKFLTDLETKDLLSYSDRQTRAAKTRYESLLAIARLYQSN